MTTKKYPPTLPQGFAIDLPRKERYVKEKANIYNQGLNAI